MKSQIKNDRTPSLLTAALISSLSILVAGPAMAATDTWNGGATPDGNWTNPGNWNGTTPATNDLLIFSGNTQTTTTNNFAVGTPFDNILFGSSAGAFTLKGNGITLFEPTDAGSGNIKNGNITSSSANAETIRVPITLNSGYHAIGSSGAGTLNLNGAITHSNGAVAIFSGNVNVSGGLSTNGSANSILGGWAIDNNNWATLDGSGNIIPFTSYSDVPGGGTIADNAVSNVRITSTTSALSTGSTVTHINSLMFDGGASAGNVTLSLPVGKTLVLGQNGGIFNRSSIAAGAGIKTLTIGGSNPGNSGIITAGDGVHPAQITFGSASLPSTATYLTIQASIRDNGTAPVTVTLAGAYISMNGGGATASTNTYSGGTYILYGRCSQPGSYTFGTGPIYVVSGGQFNTGCQITNDVYLEGSGTVENNGMGVVRIYSANLGGGVLGNLCGTVHLTGDAAIGGNNNLNSGGQLFNGISGKITGPGGLMINSPTATASGGGTITIGSTNGFPGTIFTNDYAGNTTINGTAGGTVNSMLRICLAVDNNIMPHGATGNFAGGATGNLILNGTAANRQAIFELDGSSQTINGLISTPASPLNNIIQDSVGGGSLTLGDNNATATFAGIIQNGLALTKIGNGTETLSGPNTYTGNTLVQGGVLVVNTSMSSGGQGNYSVSNNAALGVTVASQGSTLTMNNLTFGTSGTALQLAVGTNGNPTAALVNVQGALTLSGNVNISLSGIGLTNSGGPITLATYNPGLRTGSGNFVLNNSPRVVATLNDDKVNGIVTMNITSADTGVKWKGSSSTNWDISDTGNLNWLTVPSGNAAYYIEAGSGNDSVLFDDSLTGTSNVNLTTTLTPQSVTVSNSAANYLFAGSGRITGATGLTKAGSGTLTLGSTGNNDFSGPIAINGGTLVVSNNAAWGNTISGIGALTKIGNSTLTLSGDGTGYFGPVAVGGGTLSVLNTISLATASGITISNGATLDIGNNNVAVGQTNITVSGSGVGGNGAIGNSSGYGGGAIATSFQQVTMTGDTTIGGPGRLDFRASDPIGGGNANLNTGGNSYNLTKVSGNTLLLSSVVIDPNLANINVQAGTLGLQGTLPSLGNPSSQLTVAGGATLQFFDMQNSFTKVLMLQDGATVTNSDSNTTLNGPAVLQGNEFFRIAGGTILFFTNVISGPGSLSQVAGTGQITLTASNTYSGNTIINAGTLALQEPGDIRNSRAITIGAGTTLDVSGRADTTLTILGGHSLDGIGTLNGNLTNLPSSLLTVGPVASTATFSVSGNVSLAGTNIMKVVETNATADLLAAGSITFGGTLQINVLAGYFKTGESFQLFSAGGFNGSFSNIVPATPGFNLSWDTNALATTGFLSVIGPGPNTAPTNLVASFDGVNLNLNWPMDHTGWQLQAQTNNLATGLSGNWVNVPGTGTTNQVSIPVGAGNGSVFYRMVLQ